MDNIIKLMNDLEISENPVKLLSEMKISVMSVPSQDFSSVSTGNVKVFQPLFDFLNSDNKQQVSACVAVLYQILQKLKPQVVLSSFVDQILRGFNHPNEDVRILVVKQICQCCEDSSCLEDLFSENNVLNSICKCLTDSSLDVIKYSKKALLCLHKHDDVDSRSIINLERSIILKNVMATSDSCRYQVYEILVHLSISKLSSLVHISSYGFLQPLVDEITSGDVLTQLNALELLSELVMCQHGFEFLQKAGIVAKLSYLLSTARNDTMAAIILPGILKFFGHVGSMHPNLLAESKTSGLVEIMRVASDYTTNTEVSIQLIAFETLAHIGSTVEGKCALQKFNVEMENTIKDLADQMTSFGIDMKVRFLDAVALLFTFQSLTGCSEDLIAGMKTWFDNLSKQPSLKFLLDLGQKPFPDVLLAILKIMKAVALLPWGIELIAEEPSMIEWLLDRSSCMNKETKDERFDVVTAIHQNQWAKEHYNQDLLDNIAKFHSQGPFYVQADYVVAVEKQ